MRVLIDDNIWNFDLTEALQQISPQRREQALQFRHELGQRQCVLSYLLLKRALHEVFGIDENSLQGCGSMRHRRQSRRHRHRVGGTLQGRAGTLHYERRGDSKDSCCRGPRSGIHRAVDEEGGGNETRRHRYHRQPQRDTHPCRMCHRHNGQQRQKIRVERCYKALIQPTPDNKNCLLFCILLTFSYLCPLL